MNIASLIGSFATSASYVVMRTAANGQTVRGRIGEGAQTTITVVGSVSPASGRDVKNLPEGRQYGEARVIYTATELYAGGQGSDFEADLVVIDAKNWQVAHVERWVDPRSRGSFFKAIVVLE